MPKPQPVRLSDHKLDCPFPFNEQALETDLGYDQLPFSGSLIEALHREPRHRRSGDRSSFDRVEVVGLFAHYFT
jgi:hypothetical protein